MTYCASLCETAGYRKVLYPRLGRETKTDDLPRSFIIIYFCLELRVSGTMGVVSAHGRIRPTSDSGCFSYVPERCSFLIRFVIWSIIFYRPTLEQNIIGVCILRLGTVVLLFISSNLPVFCLVCIPPCGFLSARSDCCPFVRRRIREVFQICPITARRPIL